LTVFEQARTRPSANPVPRMLINLLPFVGLLLAWWGQGIVDQGDDLQLGVAAYFVATVLFVLSVWYQNPERPAEDDSSGEETHIRPLLIVIAFALTPLVFVESSGNQFRLLGVILWCASIGLFLKGLPHKRTWNPISSRLKAAWQGKGLLIRWEWVALLAITLVGAFYRLYRLDGILAEMGTDLPLNYANVEELLKGNYVIYFTTFPGREALFFYVSAIFANLFGLSHLTIKFTAALLGTLTIPALFVTARRLFNTEVGLYGALLLAINHWHITLSRIGYRAILLPLFAIVLLYLIARALDRRRDWDFACAGLWLGLGMYTYNSWMLAPVAFVFALLAYWIARRDISLRTVVRFIAIAAAGAFIVFVPLGRYGIEQPDTYFMRVATRITSQEQPLPPDPVGVFADNLKRSLAMFNYRGDSVFVVNVPYLREMEFATAVLFVLGIGFILARLRRGYNMVSLTLFLVFLMPSALSIAFPNEVPSSDRASGGVVLAFLFAALPLSLLREHLAKWLPAVRAGPFALSFPLSEAQELRVKGTLAFGTAWLVPALGLVLIFGDALSSFHSYFVDYVYAQPFHNYPLSLELARAMDDFSGNGPVYIKYLPYWYDGNALRAQLQETSRTWSNESDHFDTSSPPFLDFHGKFMYILHPDDKEGLMFLQKTFPGGKWVDHYDSLGSVEFVTFYGVR
jgi:4-amino-4-deoxy-L-arabinose transferase-like glycosyltransferase